MKEAPGKLRVDYAANVTVAVSNNGSTPATNYNIAVYNGETQLATAKGNTIEPGKTAETTLTFMPQRNIGNAVNLYARIEGNADEAPTNNVTDTVSLQVAYPVYPTAKQLKATAGAKNTLTWVAPDAQRTTDEAVTESFETIQTLLALQ